MENEQHLFSDGEEMGTTELVSHNMIGIETFQNHIRAWQICRNRLTSSFYKKEHFHRVRFQS